jgi:hypothetical protein
MRELERKVSDEPTCGCSPASARTGGRAGAPMFAALGIEHHGTGAVVDLRLLAGRGDDHHASFGRLRSTPFAHKALHALVAAGEIVLGSQVLPDRPRIAAAAEPPKSKFARRDVGLSRELLGSGEPVGTTEHSRRSGQVTGVKFTSAVTCRDIGRFGKPLPNRNCATNVPHISRRCTSMRGFSVVS